MLVILVRVFTYHVNKLGQLELDLDSECIRHIDNWSHEFIVIGEEVIVQSFRVWISS